MEDPHLKIVPYSSKYPQCARILEIAHLTNSVMVTCDENFKDRALLANRPTIYIHPDLLSQVKIIEEVRTP